MEALIVFSAWLLMPIYAAIFINSVIVIAQKLIKQEELGSEKFAAIINFTLMMWTISASIILTAQ